MADVTKKDVQQIVDGCRKQLQDRMLDRQEIVRINEQIRDRLMNYTQDLMQVHEQKYRRRIDTQMNDVNRRMADIETRIYGLEKDSKLVLQLLQQLAQSQSQGVVEPAAEEQQQAPNSKAYSTMRYLYQQ